MNNPDKEKMEIFEKSCRSIVEYKGACWYIDCIDCGDCPFYDDNNGYDITCIDLGAAKEGYKETKDPIRLESAQKFLDGIVVFHKGKLVEVVDE